MKPVQKKTALKIQPAKAVAVSSLVLAGALISMSSKSLADQSSLTPSTDAYAVSADQEQSLAGCGFSCGLSCGHTVA